MNSAVTLPNASEFVLYWMQTAIRTEENPALDAARIIAKELNKPLLVYHALSERYLYASDRHHTFILEGARDVQQQFSRLEIDYFFHLERRRNRPPLLRDLANRAALVVVEDMPTLPAKSFVRGLRRVAATPIWAVDTSCVVPMQTVGKAYERAFEFRQATQSMYQDRIETTWPILDFKTLRLLSGSVPGEAIDLSSVSIADIVAECEIDHLVGPVVDTVGGSRAGYLRWEDFRNNRLSRYASKRNDPLVDGTSRMSAYLHYGMVSPFRIAREAAAHRSAGGDKFLDELLIWRELAYNFCHFQPGHYRWTALPDWARITLEKHANDPREKIYDEEELARGLTHDRLWNGAQKSLLIHGELHNNVRMTWGKAILNWKKSPKEALRTMIDLNHRYALDGRDPASYGGILWCLGLFDRPFTPEQPVLGVVRPRSTEEHAIRLDVEQYSQRVSRSRVANPPKIGIVGAGLSGAIAARTLLDHGLSVTVFEKSRGVGGRMATRRDGDRSFDHGAQYFTARDPRFSRHVETWLDKGVVARWEGPIAVYDQFAIPKNAPSIDRFVGVPAMNSVVKHLLSNVDVKNGVQIDSVQRTSDRWKLLSTDGTTIDDFDRIVVTVPAPQSRHILRNIPELAEALANVETAPCWCVMLMLEHTLPVAWNGAFVNVGPIRWMARNSTKPGRDSSESIVIHASPEWSIENLERDASSISDEIFAEFQKVIGLVVEVPHSIQSHRWRYSIPTKSYPNRCAVNHDRTVFASGDWAGGPKVEGAFLSGAAAAGRILSTLGYSMSKPRQRALFD